jgi:2-oxoisovalerate dehydrogenase E2 component (dihydrolipoyl transacylase)
MTDIKMPQLGESVTEGTVARWLKQPGDQVGLYEPILEVTADKVDTEVPSPAAGVLAEIVVPEGQTVKVGTVIARLAGADGRDAKGAGQPAEPPAAADQQAAAPAAAPAMAAAPPAAPRGAPPISPVVAKLAAEHALDLAKIRGTGVGGRVSKQDVLRYLEASSAEQTQAEELVAPTPATVPAPGQPALDGDEEIAPLTPMRRAIAEHMVRSVQSAPHVTTVFEVDLGRVGAHREQMRAALERQGLRLTYTAYFVQAAAQALRAVPQLNGRYSEAGLVLNRRVHIGVAVALDEGLLVPVVRDADERSLAGLARAVGDLSSRARSRRLAADEVQGGTFTITNHGVSGSLFATPIINQPQSAILGVGAIVRRPVVVEQAGIEAIAIRPMCYLSLTFDHRVCDGAAADGFLATIKRFLEEYSG